MGEEPKLKIKNQKLLIFDQKACKKTFDCRLEEERSCMLTPR